VGSRFAELSGTGDHEPISRRHGIRGYTEQTGCELRGGEEGAQQRSLRTLVLSARWLTLASSGHLPSRLTCEIADFDQCASLNE